MQYTSFNSYLETTNRLSISIPEAETAIMFMRTNDKHGLTVRLHDTFKDHIRSVLDDGILLLTSPILDCDFLFLKIDNGKGLFGRQRSRYLSAIGSYNDDALMPGATFRNIAIALTSINNVFRDQGFAKGSIV